MSGGSQASHASFAGGYVMLNDHISLKQIALYEKRNHIFPFKLYAELGTQHHKFSYNKFTYSKFTYQPHTPCPA